MSRFGSKRRFWHVRKQPRTPFVETEATLFCRRRRPDARPFPACTLGRSSGSLSNGLTFFQVAADLGRRPPHFRKAPPAVELHKTRRLRCGHSKMPRNFESVRNPDASPALKQKLIGLSQKSGDIS